MDRRIELQGILEEILGSRNVYYQPPESVKMNYPAIRYTLSNIDKTSADDSAYLRKRIYELTFIDYSPDNPVIEDLLALEYCTYNRHYSADNLSHDVFTIHY